MTKYLLWMLLFGFFLNTLQILAQESESSEDDSEDSSEDSESGDDEVTISFAVNPFGEDVWIYPIDTCSRSSLIGDEFIEVECVGLGMTSVAMVSTFSDEDCMEQTGNETDALQYECDGEEYKFQLAFSCDETAVEGYWAVPGVCYTDETNSYFWDCVNDEAGSEEVSLEIFVGDGTGSCTGDATAAFNFDTETCNDDVTLATFFDSMMLMADGFTCYSQSTGDDDDTADDDDDDDDDDTPSTSSGNTGADDDTSGEYHITFGVSIIAGIIGLMIN